MNESFRATIAFALLTLLMIFLASTKWGQVAAIIATGAAYGAQMCFTQSAGWLSQYQAQLNERYAGPKNTDAFKHYEVYHYAGLGLQVVSIVAAVAGLAILIGTP